jgi:hypothetical protein
MQSSTCGCGQRMAAHGMTFDMSLRKCIQSRLHAGSKAWTLDLHVLCLEWWLQKPLHQFITLPFDTTL